jgi:AraC-like DNA-binding protein
VDQVTVVADGPDQVSEIGAKYFSQPDLQLVGARGITARYAIIQAGPLVVADARFSAGITSTFGHIGAHQIHVPLRGITVWHQQHRGRHVTRPGAAAVFDPEGAMAIDEMTAGTHAVGMTITTAAVQAHLDLALGHPAAHRIRFGPDMNVSDGYGASWLRLLRATFTGSAPGDPLTAHPVVGPLLVETLITGMLLATDHPHRETLVSAPPLRPPPQSVKTAVEAIRERPSNPFTVAALAATAGVDVRTLQAGFRDRVGMSVLQYLRHVRIGAAHDDMARADPADPDATVSSIARRYGFTDVRRFAGLYAARYGTAPARPTTSAPGVRFHGPSPRRPRSPARTSPDRTDPASG